MTDSSESRPFYCEWTGYGVRIGQQDRTVTHIRVHFSNVRKAREKHSKFEEEIRAEEDQIVKFKAKSADGTTLPVFEDVHDHDGNRIGERVVRTCESDLPITGYG